MNFIDKLLARFRTPDPRDAEMNRMAVNSRLTEERVERLENPEMAEKRARLRAMDAIVEAGSARQRRSTDA